MIAHDLGSLIAIIGIPLYIVILLLYAVYVSPRDVEYHDKKAKKKK